RFWIESLWHARVFRAMLKAVDGACVLVIGGLPMSDELPEAFPAVIRPAAEPPLTVIESPVTGADAPAPPAGVHPHTAAAVFSQRQDDSGAGLVWAMSAGMLLHDVLKDTLATPKDEEEEDDPPKKTAT